jgi:hypothetical protein
MDIIVPILRKNASLISSYVILDVIGLSRVSYSNRTFDVFHMVVDLCKVLNPCSAKCRENEVALLTNQEGICERVVVESI